MDRLVRMLVDVTDEAITWTTGTRSSKSQAKLQIPSTPPSLLLLARTGTAAVRRKSLSCDAESIDVERRDVPERCCAPDQEHGHGNMGVQRDGRRPRRRGP